MKFTEWMRMSPVLCLL